MSDFLPIGLQDIMHRWQSGLQEVDKKTTSCRNISARGLIFKIIYYKGERNEYI